MVDQLTYHAGSVDQAVSLSGPVLYAETIPNLRSGEWTYKQQGKLLRSRARASHTETINVKARDAATLDAFLDLVDADVANSKPGILTADDWQATVYIVKDSAQLVTPNVLETQLTVLIVEGVWRKKTPYSYVMATLQGEGLDYPHDYPFDYTRSDVSAVIGNDLFVDQSIDLTIYGPVSNPRITIAGNTYAVDVVVSAGERLEIDSLRCFVTLVKADGTRVTVISKAKFEEGMNVFATLPPGGGDVTWNNAFSFDIATWQERGRAPWA